MDLLRVQKSMTRENVNAFLDSVGIDPTDVVEVHMTPNRVIVTRFLYEDDGKTIRLDHLGPRTAESHFNIIG